MEHTFQILHTVSSRERRKAWNSLLYFLSLLKVLLHYAGGRWKVEGPLPSLSVNGISALNNPW